MSDKKNHIIREALQKIEGGANWRLEGPVIKSREGDIYRAFSVESGLTLAVKLFRPHVKRAAPQQQFDAFQRYQASMASEGSKFKVPKVFSCDKEHRLLIMEWMTGKSLHRHLWMPSIKDSQSHALLNKTGKWLRLFHEASTVQISEVNFANYLGAIEKQMASYSAGSFSFGHAPQWYSESYDFLKQTLSCLPLISAPYAVSHGDFTPFNLLLDSNHTVGLDIWASERKPIHVDLARMVTYLTIAYPLVTRQQVYDEAGRIQKRLMPLLKGYGTDLIDPASNHFKISLLSEYLRRWLVIKSRSLTIKGFVADRYQASQIKKQIQTILSGLHLP